MLFAADLHFGKEVPGLHEWLERQVVADESKVLVIPGDFTMSGKESEYQAAGRFLGRLRRLGVRIIATPGANDFGRRVAARYLPSHDQRAKFREHVFPQISTQRGIIAGRDYDTVTRIGDDVFIALRSAHKEQTCPNRIRRAQLEWANKVLSEARFPETARLHLVTHRSLWHACVENTRQPDMCRSERIETELLGNFPFYSFIHGHGHPCHFAHRGTPELGLPIYHLSVPSLAPPDDGRKPGIVRWTPGVDDARFVAFDGVQPAAQPRQD